MISSCCFCLLSLYLARILSISGFRSCMARMLLTCLTVRGKSRVRTITVRMTMLSHHGAPNEWKNSRASPTTPVSGANTLPKKSVMTVVKSIKSFSSHRINSSPRPRVAPQYPPGPHETSPDNAILLYSLNCILRAGRPVPAGGWQHRGDEPTIHSNEPYEDPPRTHLGPTGGLSDTALAQPAQGADKLLV